jgi:hypothetical protein
MTSKNMTDELGKAVMEHEKKLAAEKLKDMHSVFANLAKLMDTASKLNGSLANFTERYGMSKQAVDELFSLTSPQVTLIRSSVKTEENINTNNKSNDIGQPKNTDDEGQY